MASAVGGYLERWSFWLFALCCLAVVGYGFSFTVDENLLHAAKPRPLILWAHAIVFSAWLLLFLAQATLVRTRQIRWHRSLGAAGVALGFAVIVVGIWASITMGHLHVLDGSKRSERFLIVPIGDIVSFTVLFAAAVMTRARSDYHRRFMFLATCALTSAGWGRFPEAMVPDEWFEAFVSVLVLIGVLRDLIVMHRVHRAYLIGWPILLAIQGFEMYTYLNASPWWMAIAHRLIG